MISEACHETHHSARYGERPCPWTMVRAGNLGPMYFLDSVNMDGPVVEFRIRDQCNFLRRRRNI